MGEENGELYALYDSYAVTAELNQILPGVTLTSVANYQDFNYAGNSDYDFTSVPSIWADQHNSYSALSEELRALTSFEGRINFLAGVYYQKTALRFTQSAMFFNAENSLASPAERYVSIVKDSDTDGETFAGYGQSIWDFQPGWELTAGARYIHETKQSWFIQPYVHPFFAGLYAANHRLEADQSFDEVSPEVTLTWQPADATTLYAAYRTGYKSGGFSNSADEIVGSAGVDNLTFEPETARGGELGAKLKLVEAHVALPRAPRKRGARALRCIRESCRHSTPLA